MSSARTSGDHPRLIAIAWYGVRTSWRQTSLNIVFIKLFPGLGPAEYADVAQHGFLGLSYLGYVSFAVLWVAQAAVFWRGMNSYPPVHRLLIGPAVYVVMVAPVHLHALPGGLERGRPEAVGQGASRRGGARSARCFGAIALVVAYFSGPMLNFGDFARYGRSP